jgi:transcriptional regulator with XRE-family HTH domain
MLRELRVARVRRSWTLNEVARRAPGLHPSRLSLLERGEIEPTDRDREAIRKVFGCDPDLLLRPIAEGVSV